MSHKFQTGLISSNSYSFWKNHRLWFSMILIRKTLVNNLYFIFLKKNSTATLYVRTLVEQVEQNLIHICTKWCLLNTYGTHVMLSFFSNIKKSSKKQLHDETNRNLNNKRVCYRKLLLKTNKQFTNIKKRNNCKNYKNRKNFISDFFQKKNLQKISDGKFSTKK